MPRFRYRALRQTGGEVAGELLADDEREAATQLQASGSFPIEIAPAAKPAGAERRAGKGVRLSGRELVLFTRQFATLMKAGIALDRALTLIAADRAPSRRARLASSLLAAINRGESLSRAVAAEPAFAQHYAMVIAAGEARGDLGGALERLANVLERNRAISQSLLNALIYPASVLVVAFLSLGFLLAFVVPRFESLLTSFRQEPPLALRWLVGLSQFFQSYGLPLAVAILALVAFFLIRRRDAAFRIAFDRRLLALPGLGSLLTKIETERLTFLLGNLVAAGVELPRAVAATRDAMTNAAIRAGLGQALRGIERGDGVSPSLAAARLLPDLALELVRVGEETGDLAPMLLQASDIMRKEVEGATTELIGLIAPISIILLGLLIGGIALALFGTVMEVYDLAS
jgi:general secretion pathway protein F